MYISESLGQLPCIMLFFFFQMYTHTHTQWGGAGQSTMKYKGICCYELPSNTFPYFHNRILLLCGVLIPCLYLKGIVLYSALLHQRQAHNQIQANQILHQETFVRSKKEETIFQLGSLSWLDVGLWHDGLDALQLPCPIYEKAWLEEKQSDFSDI